MGGPRAHPRACGENGAVDLTARPSLGSSPRVRGKPAARSSSPADRGLIPARAGKTGGSVCRSRSPRAHPRACGENMAEWWSWSKHNGSSPRVRGKRSGMTFPYLKTGLIPARAGKTMSPKSWPPTWRAHPRACGENAPADRHKLRELGSSPRVRGKLQAAIPDRARRGLIPARAGKTLVRRAAMRFAPAHPRACGENPPRSRQGRRRRGSSPRVRGKPGRGPARRDPPRLIPARAGKTT